MIGEVIHIRYLIKNQMIMIFLLQFLNIILEIKKGMKMVGEILDISQKKLIKKKHEKNLKMKKQNNLFEKLNEHSEVN